MVALLHVSHEMTSNYHLSNESCNCIVIEEENVNAELWSNDRTKRGHSAQRRADVVPRTNMPAELWENATSILSLPGIFRDDARVHSLARRSRTPCPTFQTFVICGCLACDMCHHHPLDHFANTCLCVCRLDSFQN